MPFAQLTRAGRVHYAERGERRAGAAAVVLVHGAGASAAIWVMTMAKVGRAAHVVALDLPGHGASPLPEAGRAGLTIEAYRDVVGELAGELCLWPSVLVGHSMGALVAIEAALAWPEKVRGLVLAASAPRLSIADELHELLRHDPARVPEWMATHALSPTVKPVVRRAFAAAGLVTPPETMLADLLAVRAVDFTERLGRLTCPVIWLDGADDAIVPFAEGRPGIVRRLENVGHLVPIEAPGAIAEAVAELGGGGA